jgi:hypothetical protein
VLVFLFLRGDYDTETKERMITIEISEGEALDRLSVLDLKRNQISDEVKLHYVSIEHEALYSKVRDIIEDSFISEIYSYMKFVNGRIWELVDKLRSKQGLDQGLCRMIQEFNDARHRLKRKIDVYLSSDFREQKSFGANYFLFDDMAFIEDVGGYKNLIPYIKYTSLFYDNVMVPVGNEEDKMVMAPHFIYDPSIRFPMVWNLDKSFYDTHLEFPKEDMELFHSFNQ